MICWVINIAILVVITLLTLRAIKGGLSHSIFFSGLSIRFIGGISAAFIFLEVYRSSDSVTFYEIAGSLLEQYSLGSIIKGDFEFENLENQPRVLFFIRVLSFFLFVSGGSYWITTLYFALFSFICSWYFIIEFIKLYPKQKVVVTSCFLFIPSVVFWSSGILKDTLAFNALLILVIQVLKINRANKFFLAEILFGILSVVILLKIKHYLLIAFLLFSGLTFGILVFRRLKGALKWGLSLLVLVIFFFLSQTIHPYLKVQRIPQTIFENNSTINKRTSSEKQVGIIVADPTWRSVLTQVPYSLFTGLFRPTIFDKTPTLGMIHKIENLILLSLFMFSILLIIKEQPHFNWPVLAPSVLCICTLATLLALTTPNLGTLVRYKNAFMPFLFLITSTLPYKYLTSTTE